MRSAIFLSIVLVLGAIPGVGQKRGDTGDSRIAAERLWELAISAKGGRQKLNSVDNIVISSSKVASPVGALAKSRLEDLYVFPDRWWSWDDERPSHFGLNMKMYDWRMGKAYSQQYEGVLAFSGLTTIEKKKGNSGFPGLIDILLETRWDKVIPNAATKGEIQGKTVQIVRSTLGPWRLDFYLDAGTYLPVRVVSYKGDKPAVSTRMSEYVDVDGIKMPLRYIIESPDGDVQYRRSYQLNVEYDESIFSAPPSFERGPSAWKKR